MTILWHNYGDESKNVGILNLELVGYQINSAATSTFGFSLSAHRPRYHLLIPGGRPTIPHAQ